MSTEVRGGAGTELGRAQGSFGQERDRAPGLLMSLSRRPGPLDSVLIHPAGGGLGQYLRIARRLARHGPVYGIRATGLLPGESPHDSVARMSEVYRELLGTLPRPPGLLIGWSLGGVLAWELAAGTAPGREPPAVVMIDSHAELPPESSLARTDLLAGIERSVSSLTSGLAPDLLRGTARAHITAARSHRVRHRCDTPALLLTCAAPERAAQVARWLSLGPRLTVRELDCGHFEVFAPAQQGALLGHIDRFVEGILAAPG